MSKKYLEDRINDLVSAYGKISGPKYFENQKIFQKEKEELMKDVREIDNFIREVAACESPFESDARYWNREAQKLINKN